MLTYEMREGDQKIGLENFCESAKSILGDKNLKIIEIGSYCGSGTLILNNYFPNSQICCIDIWEKYIEKGSTYDLDRQEMELKEAEKIFDERIENFSNINKIKMFSDKYVNEIDDESLDLVYIDGNHDYEHVIEDITNWFPKVKPGAIFGGHDYSWQTVRNAIADTIGETPYQTFIDSSWYFVKGENA